MKKDAEVLRYMRERRKGTKQELAAHNAFSGESLRQLSWHEQPSVGIFSSLLR